MCTSHWALLYTSSIANCEAHFTYFLLQRLRSQVLVSFNQKISFSEWLQFIYALWSFCMNLNSGLNSAKFMRSTHRYCRLYLSEMMKTKYFCCQILSFLEKYALQIPHSFFQSQIERHSNYVYESGDKWVKSTDKMLMKLRNSCKLFNTTWLDALEITILRLNKVSWIREKSGCFSWGEKRHCNKIPQHIWNDSTVKNKKL